MWPTESKQAPAGFTLIELSIVLIIIGLVVGGVLVGQNLIAAAAVRAQITQIEKYNTAVNTFREKYGGLPGDLAISSANQFGFYVPSSCTGGQGQRDGNGLIDGHAASAQLAALMGENALFWLDLEYAHMIDFTPNWSPSNGYNLCAGSLSVPASGFLPPAAIGNGNYLHVYESNGANWYLLANIGAFIFGSSTVNATATIPVIQAYNLDKKVDDGIPTTGRVQAVYINGSQSSTTPAPNAATDSPTTCYNTTTTPAAYSINYNGGFGANCALSFQFQ